MKLQDLRSIKSILFHDSNSFCENTNLDEKILTGFLEKGDAFLNGLNGEFAFVLEDKKSNKIFAIRDWIGEMPLHYIVENDMIYFANFVSDLAAHVPNYSYNRVVAVNRSEIITIDMQSGEIDKRLYYNFNEDENNVNYQDIESVARIFHDLLFAAVEIRLIDKPEEMALLLSGGIDSMSIAFIVSRLNKNIPAYTIEVASQQSTDVLRAKMISEAFGLRHEIINVSKEEILGSVESSVSDSEIYHMYNVFCAVGMHKLAKVLQQKNIRSVFTGEGGNEIFGDYHDWIIKDSITKEDVVLQTTSRVFDEPVGREAYIWGNLKAEKIGHYNIQLGSGLGKHGGSRMYKPMFKKNITLLSPYLEKRICKIGANIPADILKKIGGKSGFMKLVFSTEIEKGEISADFFEVNKIRFQDASEGGETGITETLLNKGFDQEALIGIFNKIFKADIVAMPHLKKTTLI